MMTETVEQALRKSHCSRKGHEHNCVGSCKITPKGIELSCPICGDDTQLGHKFSNTKVLARARRICSVIGIDLDNMPFEVQSKIVEEIFKDYCPNCNNVFILGLGSYHACSCGYTYSEYKGWYKNEKLEIK